jgi:ankyrin repeat protein
MMNREFINSASQGDLVRVQKMLADGDANITDIDRDGWTVLMCAAGGSESLPTLIWLLKEGSACSTDRSARDGYSVLMIAAINVRMVTCQWLLEHGGADIMDVTNTGQTIWDMLAFDFIYEANSAEVTALLRVMVLKENPPVELVVRLKTEHACARWRREQGY